MQKCCCGQTGIIIYLLFFFRRTLWNWVSIFIACKEFAAIREILVMCQCYSMSLEAISLPQRGSAEGVKLFCALIGLLSGIVWRGGRFWDFSLIVISSPAGWKFIVHTCERLLFSEIKWDALRCACCIVMIGRRSRSRAGTLREAYSSGGGAEFRISLLPGCHHNLSCCRRTLPACDLLSYLVRFDPAGSPWSCIAVLTQHAATGKMCADVL